MDKDKYVKWYKIAQEVISNPELIPERTDKEIMNLVSQEDWLMFAIKIFDDAKEAKNAPVPNVFMNLYRDDDKDYCRIGLTFNNVKAVDRLKNILSKFCKDEKEKLTKLLLSLDSCWEIIVSRKIKDHNWQQAPIYEVEFHANSNEIDDKIVDQIIGLVNTIRDEGTQKRLSKQGYYIETPSVNLLETNFELNEDKFKQRVKEAFEVLAVCLEVKSDREINTHLKSKYSELNDLENELDNLRKKWEHRENHLSLGTASEEQIKELKEKIKNKEEKVKLLKEELKW